MLSRFSSWGQSSEPGTNLVSHVTKLIQVDANMPDIPF